MQEHLIELTVGQTLFVGDYAVKVIAIEGEDLTFEIVDDDDFSAGFAANPADHLSELPELQFA